MLKRFGAVVFAIMLSVLTASNSYAVPLDNN